MLYLQPHTYNSVYMYPVLFIKEKLNRKKRHSEKKKHYKGTKREKLEHFLENKKNWNIV